MNLKNLKSNYDVIIVGAGPAGLSFACSLIGLNLNILIIEKCQNVTPELFFIF